MRCPKDHFFSDVDHDCYPCSHCGQGYLSQDECVKKWGLLASHSCFPEYHPVILLPVRQTTIQPPEANYLIENRDTNSNIYIAVVAVLASMLGCLTLVWFVWKKPWKSCRQNNDIENPDANKESGVPLIGSLNLEDANKEPGEEPDKLNGSEKLKAAELKPSVEESLTDQTTNNEVDLNRAPNLAKSTEVSSSGESIHQLEVAAPQATKDLCTKLGSCPASLEQHLDQNPDGAKLQNAVVSLRSAKLVPEEPQSHRGACAVEETRPLNIQEVVPGVDLEAPLKSLTCAVEEMLNRGLDNKSKDWKLVSESLGLDKELISHFEEGQNQTRPMVAVLRKLNTTHTTLKVKNLFEALWKNDQGHLVESIAEVLKS